MQQNNCVSFAAGQMLFQGNSAWADDLGPESSSLPQFIGL